MGFFLFFFFLFFLINMSILLFLLFSGLFVYILRILKSLLQCFVFLLFHSVFMLLFFFSNAAVVTLAFSECTGCILKFLNETSVFVHKESQGQTLPGVFV